MASSKKLKINVDRETDEDERFSIFGWSPDALQVLATPKFFLVLCVVNSIFVGFAGAGWFASLTSLEKRFRMPFAMLGIIRAVSEVGGFIALPIYGHFAGAGHRPRWIGWANLLSVVGIGLLVSTEVWAAVPPGSAPVADGVDNATTTMSRSELWRAGVCVPGDDMLCDVADDSGADEDASAAASGSWTISVFVALMLGQALMDGSRQGIDIIKTPYMFDNVKPKNFPVYVGVDTVFYAIGVFVGLVSMAFFSTIYYRPWSRPPGVEPGDPQWIAAWYLPLLVGAAGQAIVGVLFMGFPRQVRHISAAEKRAAQRQTAGGYAQRGVQDVLRRRAKASQIPRDIARLLCNPILMCLAAGRALDFVTDVMRVSTMKYYENQFRVTPARAAVYVALSSVTFAGLSRFIGSVGIRRWRPSPRSIMLVIWITQAISIALSMVLAYITCENQPVIVGQSATDVNAFDFNSECSAQCQCSDERFEPVCDRALNIHYFSPCRAGCPDQGQDINGTLIFDNCACVENGMVERGWCSGECSESLIYVSIRALILFVSGIPFAGNAMMIYLVVEPELKSLAMALIALFQTFFTPGGIVVAMLYDSACARWAGDGGCADGGDDGNCLLYDSTALARRIHFFGAFIKTLGQLSDTYVLYRVWNMAFPTEEKTDASSEEKKTQVELA